MINDDSAPTGRVIAAQPEGLGTAAPQERSPERAKYNSGTGRRISISPLQGLDCYYSGIPSPSGWAKLSRSVGAWHNKDAGQTRAI